MGAGPSSPHDLDLLSITKKDRLMAPACTLPKQELRLEWSHFLTTPFVDGRSRARLQKLKSRQYWPILCKFQRSMAQRLSDDAKVSERMDLLYEANALLQAAIAIHEVVTNINVADSDYGVCKARILLIEKDLDSSRHRINGPLPDQTTIDIALDEFLSCSWLLNSIRESIRKMTTLQKWSLTLYSEFMAAAKLAQGYADRAIDLAILPASREFYRCAMHLFGSDPLIQALQTVNDEIEYQEFAAKLYKTDEPTLPPDDISESLRAEYDSIMEQFPHVIREDMRQVSPSSMSSITRFIKELDLANEEVVVAPSTMMGSVMRPGHKNTLSEILSTRSQHHHDGAAVEMSAGAPLQAVEVEASPSLHEKDDAAMRAPADNATKGGSTVRGGKAAARIADLQAKLNLNETMFLGQLPPKALAMKKGGPFQKNDHGGAPDSIKGAISIRDEMGSIHDQSTTPVEAALGHANLVRPIRAKGRRMRTTTPTDPIIDII